MNECYNLFVLYETFLSLFREFGSLIGAKVMEVHGRFLTVGQLADGQQRMPA